MSNKTNLFGTSTERLNKQSEESLAEEVDRLLREASENVKQEASTNKKPEGQMSEPKVKTVRNLKFTSPLIYENVVEAIRIEGYGEPYEYELEILCLDKYKEVQDIIKNSESVDLLIRMSEDIHFKEFMSEYSNMHALEDILDVVGSYRFIEELSVEETVDELIRLSREFTVDLEQDIINKYPLTLNDFREGKYNKSLKYILTLYKDIFKNESSFNKSIERIIEGLDKDKLNRNRKDNFIFHTRAFSEVVVLNKEFGYPEFMDIIGNFVGTGDNIDRDELLLEYINEDGNFIDLRHMRSKKNVEGIMSGREGRVKVVESIKKYGLEEYVNCLCVGESQKHLVDTNIYELFKNRDVAQRLIEAQTFSKLTRRQVEIFTKPKKQYVDIDYYQMSNNSEARYEHKPEILERLRELNIIEDHDLRQQRVYELLDFLRNPGHNKSDKYVKQVE